MLSLAGVPVYAVDFNTDVLMPQTDRILIFPGSPGPAILSRTVSDGNKGEWSGYFTIGIQIAFLEPPFSDSDNEKPLPDPA